MNKKTILITGGSKGIGANIVKTLAKKGYNIILNYNKSTQSAVQIQTDLKNNGINIEIFKADITKPKEVQSLISFCINKFKKLDVLINNAGISQIKMFTDLTNDDWDNMILTNLTSAFYTCQNAAKYMIKEKSGCIINISSIWGTTGASCEVHYSASKAGLDGFTKSLAKELGPSNIRVNSIAPGIINTSINSTLSKQDLNIIKNSIPLNTIGTPESISNCICWLIEDNYTTGQIIGINGGWNI